MTKAQRVLRARIGGYACRAAHDPQQYTAPARAAFLSRFDDAVDPDRRLSPEERARRAEAARSAHFIRLALASVTARAKKNPHRTNPGGGSQEDRDADTSRLPQPAA